jgi:hypothetical protein
MRSRCLLLIPWLFFAGFACGQNPGPPPDADTVTKADTTVGSYSVVVTALEPSPATHLLNPPLTIDVPPATEMAPKDFSGTKAVPPQYAVDGFGNPRFDCIPAAAGEQACDAVDRSDLTFRDANTVAYHIANHGGAVQLSLNLLVHDISPVSRVIAEASWRAKEVIFVSIPKPAPAFHFVSAVLVGDWNGNAIVFEPGKPLPDSAKKALDDLGIHQDLGDKILYSYKVKEPKPSK